MKNVIHNALLSWQLGGCSNEQVTTPINSDFSTMVFPYSPRVSSKKSCVISGRPASLLLRDLIRIQLLQPLASPFGPLSVLLASRLEPPSSALKGSPKQRNTTYGVLYLGPGHLRLWMPITPSRTLPLLLHMLRPAFSHLRPGRARRSLR